MNAIAQMLLELLYPRGLCCGLCDKEAVLNELLMCEHCAEAIKFCGEMESLANTDGFTAGIIYDKTVAGAIHALKYNDKRYLADFFARLIMVPEEWFVDVIVPVPLHKRRMRKRGYNQSALLGASLSKRLCIPMDESLLSRLKDTETQTKLNIEFRAQNVYGVFRAKSDDVTGKNILVLDDVRTTGATLSECARALREAGAVRVYAAAVCARELTGE